MISAIQSIINEYVQTVSTTYNIPLTDLHSLMNKQAVQQQQQQQLPKLPSINRDPCSYVYTRGVKAGQSCPNRKKQDSSYCSQHTKKPKDVAAAAEPTIEVTATEPPKKPNPVLRMNKVVNKWWHPDTGLVFKSSDEKIVIGIFKDDTIHDLSEDDVKTCVSYKFRYVYNKRKLEDTEEKQPSPKKAKKSINDAFIQVNQQAKNVEVLIKEMFDDGGDQEYKSNYESPHEEEEEEVEEELLEEEDDD